MTMEEERQKRKDAEARVAPELAEARAQVPYENGRMGMIERLTKIISSLTLQNMLVFAILVAIAIPSYAFWQFLHDTDFRREILSYAKQMDAGVPCQVIVYSFTGGGEKHAVLANVDTSGPYELLLAVRSGGPMSQKELLDNCTLVKNYAGELRILIEGKGKQ